MTQGAGDLRKYFADTIVPIKGKLPAKALVKFFEELRPSRSRTVTLGVLRAKASPGDDDTQAFLEVPLPASLCASGTCLQ